MEQNVNPPTANKMIFFSESSFLDLKFRKGHFQIDTKLAPKVHIGFIRQNFSLSTMIRNLVEGRTYDGLSSLSYVMINCGNFLYWSPVSSFSHLVLVLPFVRSVDNRLRKVSKSCRQILYIWWRQRIWQSTGNHMVPRHPTLSAKRRLDTFSPFVFLFFSIFLIMEANRNWEIAVSWKFIKYMIKCYEVTQMPPILAWGSKSSISTNHSRHGINPAWGHPLLALTYLGFMAGCTSMK